MKKEFEYWTLAIELNDDAPTVIKDELTRLGREGFMVVGTSHWGGFKSPKKVMYTLMRPKQPYMPNSEKPNFNAPLRSKANDLSHPDPADLKEMEEMMNRLFTITDHSASNESPSKEPTDNH